LRVGGLPRLDGEAINRMIIRTRLVELSSLEAVAYRQKLRGGQVGVVILRPDCPQPGLALLDRQSGTPDPAPNVPADLYPAAAFAEALELTAGLPYSSRGAVHRSFPPAPSPTAGGGETTLLTEEPAAEDLATVNSADYAAIVTHFTNKKGELSYDLLNKALIQAAHANAHVAQMIASGATLEAVRDHVLKANFESVSGNRSLSTAEVERIVQLLDEVSPRSVLRPFEEELRRLLAGGKV